MKYKNIVFDFGNVIGKFNGRDLVKHFSSCEEDQELLFTAIFSRWDDIDNGSVDYEQNIDNIAASLPDRLESAVRTLFREWPRHLTPINDTLRFIDELKERNIPLYLLSNAPTYFAEYAVNYDFLKSSAELYFPLLLKWQNPILQSTVTCLKRFPLIRKNVSLSTIWKKISMPRVLLVWTELFSTAISTM